VLTQSQRQPAEELESEIEAGVKFWGYERQIETSVVLSSERQGGQ
jgi:hypothetical protein